MTGMCVVLDYSSEEMYESTCISMRGFDSAIISRIAILLPSSVMSYEEILLASGSLMEDLCTPSSVVFCFF